jgi:hypothetical protein
VPGAIVAFPNIVTVSAGREREETELASRVGREYRLCEMRWSILHNERTDMENEVEAMREKEAAAGLVLGSLSREETRIGDQMALLHAELELVRKHKQEQEQRVRGVLLLFICM